MKVPGLSNQSDNKRKYSIADQISPDLIAGNHRATLKWLDNNKDKSFDRGELANNRCFECGVQDPQWISVNNGIFICLNCAGLHRSFGVQVSFVRSLEMDNISDLQKKMLVYGGNK